MIGVFDRIMLVWCRVPSPCLAQTKNGPDREDRARFLLRGNDPLIHVLAAIDRQGRAGDKACIIGSQEKNAAGDIISLSKASDRNARDNFL
jgi:hypothetical protein